MTLSSQSVGQMSPMWLWHAVCKALWTTSARESALYMTCACSLKSMTDDLWRSNGSEWQYEGGRRHRTAHFHPFTPFISCSVRIKSAYRHTDNGEKKEESFTLERPQSFSCIRGRVHLSCVFARGLFGLLLCSTHTHTPPDTPIFSPLISHQSHKHMFSFHSSSASTTWRGKCLGGILTCCLQLTGSG